jgi:hypothetical protein
MSKRNIHIDRLQIRLPRSAAGSAREIAGNLGNDILRNLSEATSGRRGSMRIEEVSAGKIKDTGADGIRKQAAKRIAAELKKRFEE